MFGVTLAVLLAVGVLSSEQVFGQENAFLSSGDVMVDLVQVDGGKENKSDKKELWEIRRWDELMDLVVLYSRSWHNQNVGDPWQLEARSEQKLENAKELAMHKIGHILANPEHPVELEIDKNGTIRFNNQAQMEQLAISTFASALSVDVIADYLVALALSIPSMPKEISEYDALFDHLIKTSAVPAGLIAAGVVLGTNNLTTSHWIPVFSMPGGSFAFAVCGSLHGIGIKLQGKARTCAQVNILRFKITGAMDLNVGNGLNPFAASLAIEENWLGQLTRKLGLDLHAYAHAHWKILPGEIEAYAGLRGKMVKDTNLSLLKHLSFDLRIESEKILSGKVNFKTYSHDRWQWDVALHGSVDIKNNQHVVTARSSVEVQKPFNINESILRAGLSLENSRQSFKLAGNLEFEYLPEELLAVIKVAISQNPDAGEPVSFYAGIHVQKKLGANRDQIRRELAIRESQLWQNAEELMRCYKDYFEKYQLWFLNYFSTGESDLAKLQLFEIIYKQALDNWTRSLMQYHAALELYMKKSNAIREPLLEEKLEHFILAWAYNPPPVLWSAREIENKFLK